MKYDVHGIDRKTGRPQTLTMDGPNESDAVKRAGKYLLIERVTPHVESDWEKVVSSSPPPPALPIEKRRTGRASLFAAIGMGLLSIFALGFRSTAMLFVARSGFIPGMRFQRRVRVLPGMHVNVGKHGVNSVSAGVSGVGATVGKGGVQSHVGIPGTGASVRHKH